MPATGPYDPAYWMLQDSFVSIPEVYRKSCYICIDPEYAAMGLPLCRKCPNCLNGHVPADNNLCSDCKLDDGYFSQVDI